MDDDLDRFNHIINDQLDYANNSYLTTIASRKNEIEDTVYLFEKKNELIWNFNDWQR